MTSESGSGAHSHELTARISRATIAIAVIALIAKLLGFAEKQVLAQNFGAGVTADAYFVAASVPLFVFLLVRELIEPAFLPVFVNALQAGERRRAWSVFTALLAAILVLTSAGAAALWAGAATLARWLAPGAGAAVQAQAADLLHVLAFALVLLPLSSLTYITLNACRRFALPAFGDILLKAGPPLAGVLFVEQLGVAALALGFVAGAFGRLLVHSWGLRTERPALGPPNAEARRELRILGLLMLPLVLGSVIAQFSELADNWFASLIGEGGISARTFAKKIRDLPLEIVPYTLSVVLFPHFAHLWANGAMDRVRALFTASVHGIAVAFTLLGVVLWFLAEPIVSVALERGAFDADARRAAAWPLQLYALGMVAFAVETVVVNIYFALRDTVTPIAAGIAGVILNVTLCALLIEPMGVGGVALALTASKTVKVTALVLLLPRRGIPIDWREVGAGALRLTAAALAATLALAGLAGPGAAPLEHMTLAAKAMLLLRDAGIGTGAFLVVMLFAGARERHLLAATVRVLWSALRRSKSGPRT